MKKILLVLSLVLVCSFAEARGWRSGGYSTGRTSASQTEPLDNYKGPNYPVEEALLQRINGERVRHGLRALVLDPIIHLRARRHCAWMARNSSMVHGADPGAENIAQWYPDVNSAVNAWMNSPGHAANILNPNYSLTGVAAYTDASGRIFWCQQFN